jgi:hypothetical protein
MSLELHQSARRDQPPSAGQPAETGAPAEPGSPDVPGASDPRSAAGTSAEPSAHDATSTPRVSFAPSAPDDRGASGATAEPSASAEVSGAAVGEPARNAGPGGRLDESSVDLDAPLLADAAGLRANWRRVQGRFVDDPREAVADAASLVEHTAQALVGALRQRQQLLRATWDRDRSTNVLGAPPGDSAGKRGPRRQRPAGPRRRPGHRTAAAADAPVPRLVQPHLPAIAGTAPRRGAETPPVTPAPPIHFAHEVTTFRVG